jgi:uncharacterized surface protein with fasciclin (FAS1) repeats
MCSFLYAVGDFEYWGRCTEEYSISNIPTSLENINEVDVSKESDIYNFLTSMDGEKYAMTTSTTIRRYAYHDGAHGSKKGWHVGVASPDENIIQSNLGKPSKFMISDEDWKNVQKLYDLKLLPGPRDCEGEPWDGPWVWRQFLRDYGEDSFDILGCSGNAEVKEEPLYGSAEIWKDHQKYMYELYNERVVQSGRGKCRGFENPSFPGSVEEYGERFSCFYGDNNEHHILFLGWWQGSDEREDQNAIDERAKSVDFIEREFGSDEDFVRNAKWRYCIHHMTSAKLSAGGGEDREHMELSAITDACRRHGALIFSGHHHIYSRTKMLEGVGGPNGKDEVIVSTENEDVIQEGVTTSITVGMGGYDGNCDGKYKDSAWMHTCVASLNQHRGAVIAEFDDADPRRGTFTYRNSMSDGVIVDQFILKSQVNILPPKSTPQPSSSPSTTTIETLAPTETPINFPTYSPSMMPSIQRPSNTVDNRPETLFVAECNIVDAIICQIPTLNILCDAFKAASLDMALISSPNVTLFAPTSSAFENVSLSELEDANQLPNLLLFHIVNGTRLYQPDLVCAGIVTMANGKDSRTLCEKDVPTYQKGAGNAIGLEPKIVDFDIASTRKCHAVVHLVDRLLLPNTMLLDPDPPAPNRFDSTGESDVANEAVLNISMAVEQDVTVPPLHGNVSGSSQYMIVKPGPVDKSDGLVVTDAFLGPIILSSCVIPFALSFYIP